MYFKNINPPSQNLNAYRQERSLLERKDQQIKRLQAELEEERKKTDNAVKTLESYKNIQGKYQEGGESLRAEIMRRVKAEEELAKVQQRNAILEEGIKKYIQQLKGLSTGQQNCESEYQSGHFGLSHQT